MEQRGEGTQETQARARSLLGAEVPREAGDSRGSHRPGERR